MRRGYLNPLNPHPTITPTLIYSLFNPTLPYLTFTLFIVASGKFIRGPVTSTLLIDKETFYDSGSDNEDEADSDANSNTNRAKRHSVLSTGSSLGHRSRTGSADIGSATAVTVVESFTNDANRTGVNFATDSLSRDSSVGVGGGSTNDSGKSHHSQVPPSSHSPVHHHNNSTSGPSMGSLNMSGKDNARDHHLQLFNEYSGSHPPVNTLSTILFFTHPNNTTYSNLFLLLCLSFCLSVSNLFLFYRFVCLSQSINQSIIQPLVTRPVRSKMPPL